MEPALLNDGLVFQPLTFGSLELACSLVDIDVNDLLSGDCDLSSVSLPAHRIDRFLRTALSNPSVVDGLSEELRAQVVQKVLGHFFGPVLLHEFEQVHLVSKHFYERFGGAPSGGGASTALQRVLVSFGPEAYRTLVSEMRLHECMYFLAVHTVNHLMSEHR